MKFLYYDVLIIAKLIVLGILTNYMLYRISRNMGEHYLAVCSESAVGGILNWQISVLYGEKTALVV